MEHKPKPHDLTHMQGGINTKRKRLLKKGTFLGNHLTLKFYNDTILLFSYFSCLNGDCVPFLNKVPRRLVVRLMCNI